MQQFSCISQVPRSLKNIATKLKKGGLKSALVPPCDFKNADLVFLKI
ncbi:unnamed protein product [Tenebrio molitor]|nr:unnamed protein product [Tenebrio molitor]